MRSVTKGQINHPVAQAEWIVLVRCSYVGSPKWNVPVVLFVQPDSPVALWPLSTAMVPSASAISFRQRDYQLVIHLHIVWVGARGLEMQISFIYWWRGYWLIFHSFSSEPVARPDPSGRGAWSFHISVLGFITAFVFFGLFAVEDIALRHFPMRI
jgi:hypothetical protein